MSIKENWYTVEQEEEVKYEIEKLGEHIKRSENKIETI
jgi:hypothetical protein